MCDGRGEHSICIACWLSLLSLNDCHNFHVTLIVEEPVFGRSPSPRMLLSFPDPVQSLNQRMRTSQPCRPLLRRLCLQSTRWRTSLHNQLMQTRCASLDALKKMCWPPLIAAVFRSQLRIFWFDSLWILCSLELFCYILIFALFVCMYVHYREINLSNWINADLKYFFFYIHTARFDFAMNLHELKRFISLLVS